MYKKDRFFTSRVWKWKIFELLCRKSTKKIKFFASKNSRKIFEFSLCRNFCLELLRNTREMYLNFCAKNERNIFAIFSRKNSKFVFSNTVWKSFPSLGEYKNCKIIAYNIWQQCFLRGYNYRVEHGRIYATRSKHWQQRHAL